MRRTIEDFLRHLVNLGFMQPCQLVEIMGARRQGDIRGLGEIALGRKCMRDDSVKRLLDFLERQEDKEEQWVTRTDERRVAR